MEETSGFNLKYQMEFHTDEDLDEGTVEIKIPAVLLTYRDGSYITPSDIGVPYGVPGDDYTYSKNSAMNYYYADADGNVVTLADYNGSAEDLYLVFWNYREITSGTNMAWQVLYKGLDAMEIVDMTEWALDSDITVNVTRTEEGTSDDTQLVTYYEIQTGNGSTISGLVDTKTTLTSITKKAYDNTAKSYTPELYTEKQVSAYISYWTDEGESIYDASFDDYVYIVYTVTVKGKGNQPFSLAFLEESGEGTVMGYSAGTSSNISFSYGSEDSEGYFISSSKVSASSWSETFYVVVAYPSAQVQDGTRVENTITAKLTPYDGVDEVQYKTAAASETYNEYEWNYAGGNFSASKSSNETYEAWLEIYKSYYTSGKDLGTFPFTTTFSARAYEYTHGISGTETGAYISGASYSIVAEDSSMYASGTEMTYEDYYFSSVKVTRKDYGYDIYEDTTTASCEESDVDQTVTIYAKYANDPEHGTDEWVEAGELVYGSSGGTVTYTFSSAQIAMEPYAVKAEYECVNYSTVCTISVDMVVRASSPAVYKAVYEDGVDSLVLKDTSSLSASSDGVELYSASVLASKVLEGLVGKNGASKSVTSSNDTENARVVLKYTMTAWDGYSVHDSSTASQLAAIGVESPSRNSVVFYDLLPYGVRYDASVEPVAKAAGSTSQVSITDVEITEDWNGTGRTMVAFYVEYSGADMSMYYNGVWQERWVVTFSAYYEWKDLDVVSADNNDNIFAFMPYSGADVDSAEYKTAMRALCGTAYADDGTTPDDDVYAALKVEDLNGDGDTETRNVLYACTGTDTDIAIAAEDSITKLVRADANVSAAYTTSASVENGGGYTYDITVTTIKGLSNLVVFDRLEYGYEDHSVDEDGMFDEAGYWTGTLASVDVQGLVLAGADPVVYYSADRDANVAEDGSEDIDALLTEANGWYTYDAFIAEYGDIGEAKAIAVDARKAADGTDFVLEESGSVNFRIRMSAPAELDSGNTVLDAASGYDEVTYAYNNCSFYSTTEDGTDTTSVVDGSTVNVSLGSPWTVSVEKEFGGDVPSGFEDTEFEFYFYTDGGAAFSQRIYTLYNYDEDTDTWVADPGTYATDYNGYMYLEAGQKAVFEDVTSWEADALHIVESSSIFWSVNYSSVKDEASNTLNWTVANTYRPPLYISKEITGAKSGMDFSGYGFTFTVYIYEDGDWVEYANQDYWVVESAKTNGTEPKKISEGTTNGSGEVMLSAGQTVAIFLPSAGTKYKVVETDYGDDFLCYTDIYTGTVATKGTAITVTNIWRWKGLSISKELTHQSVSERSQEFTFQLVHIEDDGSETSVVGSAWETTDSSGNAIASGTTDSNGEFTTLAAGYTITVEHLDAGETYILRETDTGEYYSSTTGDLEIEMPVYSYGTGVNYVNDWLMRDLSVTKYVAGDSEGEADDIEFTYTLTVDGVAASGAPYTVTSGGNTVGTYATGADGTFTLKANQTATFEDVGMLGDAFEVTEGEDASYPQIYPVDNGSQSGSLDSDVSTVTFVNGTAGSLMVSKSYTCDSDDSDAAAYIAAMQDTSSTEGQALRTEAAVTLTMAADGDSWPSSDITVDLIDTLTGEKSSGTWATSGITVEPWVTVVIPASELDGIESFTLMENSEDQHSVYEWSDGYWVQVSQQYPASDAAFSGTLESSPVVELVNRVSGFTLDGSTIYKRMSVGSEDPDTGDDIVWTLEYYDGSQWVPAGGVAYLTFDNSGVTCDSVLYTGADGVITLTKTDNGMPYVVFLDIEVDLNLYSGMSAGDYRLVEDLGSSGDSWGRLAGYGTDADEYTYSLSETEGTAFVNSNRSASLTVKKVTDKPSSTSFTFYLSQVISTDTDGTVLASEAGSGISYTVYDSDTDEAVSYGVTDANGSFTLQGGQYVVFEVEDGTTWIVTEGASAGWNLANLDGWTDETITGWLLNFLSANTAEAKALNTTVYAIEATTTYTSVVAGKELDPDYFNVTAYTSAGTSTLLESEDFTLEPETVQNDLGEMDIEVSYGSATDVVTVNVVGYSVKYAVAIYGIKQDTYSTDSGKTTGTAGLTFGPATGGSTRKVNGYYGYIATFRSHVDTDADGELEDQNGYTVITSDNWDVYGAMTSSEAEAAQVVYCIHQLDWEQIIEQCAKDPTVFQNCLTYGCTHSVELILNDTIGNNNYAGTMDDGDGASVLIESINRTYREWNLAESTTNYWRGSRIRATLNGKSSYTTSNKSVAGSDVLTSDTCLLSCFPEELQNAIVSKKEVSGYSDDTPASSSKRNTTYDKLWLFSTKEVFGYTSKSYNAYYEGNQYSRMSYYSKIGESSLKYLKIGINENGSTNGWWLRSVNNNYKAKYVSGSSSYEDRSDSANYYYGLAPGFCLP